MIYPLLPIFLVSVLGAGAVTLGLIEGVAESTASLLLNGAGEVSASTACSIPTHCTLGEPARITKRS
jgi:hypothetical protein